MIESGWVDGRVLSILIGSIKDDGDKNQELPNVLSRDFLSELSQETGWSDQGGWEMCRNSFELFKRRWRKGGQWKAYERTWEREKVW